MLRLLDVITDLAAYVAIRLLLLGAVLSLVAVGVAHCEDRPPLTKKQAFLDADIRDWMKQARTKCPTCKVLLTVGQMANAKGQPEPAAYMLIKDSGTDLRVGHFKTERGTNVVVLYFPTAILDVELNKFLRGANDNE